MVITDVEQAVRKAIADNKKIPEDQITLESKLQDDFDMDSLDLVDVLFDLEDLYHADLVNEQQLKKNANPTVGALVNYVYSKVNK